MHRKFSKKSLFPPHFPPWDSIDTCPWKSIDIFVGGKCETWYFCDRRKFLCMISLFFSLVWGQFCFHFKLRMVYTKIYWSAKEIRNKQTGAKKFSVLCWFKWTLPTWHSLIKQMCHIILCDAQQPRTLSISCWRWKWCMETFRCYVFVCFFETNIL